MAPLVCLADFGEDWECCTCGEDFWSEQLLTPWQTEDGDIVCEDYIKAEFYMSLHYEVYWPARWGGEIFSTPEIMTSSSQRT